MKAATETIRLRITGKVQGVGYRIWATHTAARLELRGWVRNRSDGSVEALVTGAADRISQMVKASRAGPPGARVAEVTVVPDDDDGSEGFIALPTM